MNIQKVKKYWLDEAVEALQVAKHLFEKKDYSYALFFGHLSIEKGNYSACQPNYSTVIKKGCLPSKSKRKA